MKISNKPLYTESDFLACGEYRHKHLFDFRNDNKVKIRQMTIPKS